ncbi:Protein GAR-2 a [Aphelenchoides avenae]|nr:Protein GAR-2 a [Aphelenchus avenae]
MELTTAAFNTSNEYSLTLSWSSYLLIFFMTFLSVVTVLGNLVVLLSYYLDKNIRQPSNYFIFSLAISDLIIGLEGIPVYTYFSLINANHWPFGAFLCDLWLSLDYACCLASIYTVLGITVDRFCSVKYPAAYRNWRNHRKVLLIIAATWAIPGILFSLSIFGYSHFSSQGRILRDDECYVQFMTNPYLNMGMYIAYYWSTLFVMLYLYYGIYSAAKKLATKSDQKQRRLALLSEMRKTKKETSTIIVSEAAESKSAVDSQGDTFESDSKNNNVTNSASRANGIIHYTGTEDRSTEKELEFSVPIPSIDTERETTGAFQIEDDIPFIDEDSSTSLDLTTIGTSTTLPALHLPSSAKVNRLEVCVLNDSRTVVEVFPKPSMCDGRPVILEVNAIEKKIANGREGMRRLLTVIRSRSGTRKRKRRKLAKNSHSRSENRARKALRTITVILGSFTILWTPFYVLATIYGFCEGCKTSQSFNVLYTISYYLCYVNSPLNPLCYALANQQFKRTFKRILHGDFRRT